MEYIIETKRLNLRELKQLDFDNLKDIISDEETMKYYPKSYDDNGVQKWLDWNFDNYKKYGFGLWAVELKDGIFIGDCGITLQNIAGEEVFEIGYHVNKKYWKNGYASEAAKACKKWFFENTSNTEVYSYMNIDNLASRGVATNNGMAFVKEYYDNDEHLVVYRIKKDEHLKETMNEQR